MPVTEYTWDPVTDSILEETDGVGNVLASYTNEPSAYGPLVSQHRDGESRYFHFDALGSTRELTNDDEIATDTLSYDAWGNVVHHSGISKVQFRWVGQYGYLAATVVDTAFARCRTVDNELGQWTSQDPYDSIGQEHKYAYSRNSPALLRDPSGLKVANVGDNQAACIDKVVDQIIRDLERSKTEPGCWEGRYRDRNPSPECLKDLPDCLVNSLKKATITVVKKGDSRCASATGFVLKSDPCSNSKDAGELRECNPDLNPRSCPTTGLKYIPDPTCAACPDDLLAEARIFLCEGKAFPPDEKAAQWCSVFGNLKGLYSLILHEAMHLCVGDHQSNGTTLEPDPCGRPDAGFGSTNFLRNCGNRAVG